MTICRASADAPSHTNTTTAAVVQRTSNEYCWLQRIHSTVTLAGRPAVNASQPTDRSTFRCARSLAADAIVLKPSIQGAAAHAELPRGRAHVTVVARERLLDEQPLGLLEREIGRGRSGGGGLQTEVPGVDRGRRGRREQHGAFD